MELTQNNVQARTSLFDYYALALAESYLTDQI